MSKKVMTIRMPEEDIKTVENMSQEEKKDKSEIVRELVGMGRTYKAIKKYKEKNISIGKAAKMANTSISEMIDLLAELGITNQIELDDYLEGKELAKEII